MGGDTERSFIECLTGDQVSKRFEGGADAILPIGAAAKQHTFHMPLNSDQIQAEVLAGRLARPLRALIWPTLTYGYYPAFVEYAGSSNLSSAVFESVVQEVAAGIVAQGCRTLFVLDTGIGTRLPVERALKRLNRSSVLHLQIHQGPRYRSAVARLSEQNYGSHADEPETSLMLALAPDLVDMARTEASPAAKCDVAGSLTRSNLVSPNYSHSGSYGDPTLATSAKGEILLGAMIEDLNEEMMAFVTERAVVSERPNSMRSAVQ